MIMKKIFILCIAAIAALACNRYDVDQVPASSELYATNDAAKTHLEGFKVLWDSGDAINVFAQNQSYKFSTTQSGASAKFKGGQVTIDNSSYALFPYVENATFAEGAFNLDFPTASQKAVSGTFSSKMNVAVAQCDNDKNAVFKSVGALLKFRLSQAGVDTLKRIEIKANGGEGIAFAGGVTIDFNSGEPTIKAASGAETSDVISLVPEQGTFVSGNTYYVWVAPGNYASGITVKLVTKSLLEGEKKGTSALNIARNSIVDLGDIENITYKKKGETKSYTFDFSTCPEGWPSGSDEYNSTDVSEKAYNYVLNEVTYEFTTAGCIGASKRSIVWGYDGTNVQEYFVAQAQRFLGLPKIVGWKLITVKFTQACGTNTSRKLCITNAITAQNGQAAATVKGGETAVVSTNGTEYSFNLEDTAANTRYYWAPLGKASGFATLTLVYEKVNQ